MSFVRRWIPWRFLIRRAARAYGLIDPLTLLARLRRFSEPSEVSEPLELIRAGIVFHARGLINTRAIQHNLDWVWPYWVERQFNPSDPSFIPRAFSITHVNLTHRNWTAVGRPDMALYPIVDPRGLVTPLFDGWSLDVWLVPRHGPPLLPSRLHRVDQVLEFVPDMRVTTTCRDGKNRLETRVALSGPRSGLMLELTARGSTPDGGWLVVALRPYNPEGVRFVDRIEMRGAGWLVDDKTRVALSPSPDRVLFSDYRGGDVLGELHDPKEESTRESVHCPVGMATAAALFAVPPGERCEVLTRVPLEPNDTRKHTGPGEDGVSPAQAWSSFRSGTARLSVPDPRMRFLYETSLRTLILLSAEDIVPGPYTYRRFWFRDACLMLHALLNAGLVNRCDRILDSFPDRQKRSGYFQSQEGEWDSNGQTLWIFDRFERITGRAPGSRRMQAILKGAAWIRKKRIRTGTNQPHEGLFPPGFSAEHLGPNDYYYWDALWGVAGLRGAARLASRYGDTEQGRRLTREAEDFREAVFRSIAQSPGYRLHGAIPAAPYRRMDAGAVGSLVADYPLQITPAGDLRILRTVDYLQEQCFFNGAFFQDMIHSGINVYLTLDITQTLLRAGDDRFQDLIAKVADLASPTGQWPEAIHPATGGGCMGDGQHGWAAAEWVQMMRSLFVREEDDRLVVGSGLFPEWVRTDEAVAFGPTPTPFGPVTVRMAGSADRRRLHVEGDWIGQPPPLEARVPGYAQQVLPNDQDSVPLIPKNEVLP